MGGPGGIIKNDLPTTTAIVGGPPASIPRPFPVPPGGTSPADAGQGMVGGAGNANVPKDAADAAAADADRKARAADAAAKFPANEANGSQEMQTRLLSG